MKRNIFTLILILFIFPLAKAQDLPSYVPTDGLVAYYPFNGNANDVSGNGNNGTVSGATLTADKDGNETLLPVQQKELDAKLEAIKRKMKNLESERELQIQQRVNEIAFKAIRKFNNLEEVARRFRDVGLYEYFERYLANEKARLDK